MDVETLKKKAAKEGIPQAIVEKDYALSVVLLLLSKSKISDKLVFKGGTAIKKIYLTNARFSEDLDFAVFGTGADEIINELKEIFGNKENSGIRFIDVAEEKTSAGLRVVIRFSSFLAFPQRIRFDFSFRENLVLPILKKEIVNEYGLEKATVNVLPVEEILAEKIHALLCRRAARDLFDVWFLSKQNVKLEWDVINKKFEYYNEKYSQTKLEENIESFRPSWNQDLGQFLRNIPDFDLVSKEVKNFLAAKN